MRSSLIGLSAIALASMPGLALAEDAAAASPDMNHMDMGDGTSPSDKAFAEAMAKMMKEMGQKPSGHTDRDFAVMMMPHHQGAIDMANVELKYGKDPMLRKLARGIVRAQETEIAEMKAWLAKHGK